MSEPFSYESLRDELRDDPAGIGYAAMSPAQRRVALNAPREDVLIPEASITGSQLKTELLPALFNLRGKDAETREFWRSVLETIEPDAVIYPTTTSALGLLGAAVAEGVLTQEQADAIGTRPGSRAEQLWGAGIVISDDDLGRANP